MDFNKILNNVGSKANQGLGKVAQNIPLEFAYIGYLVSKGLTIENTNDNGNAYRDLYLFTYITLEPVILVLMEDGQYKDVKTGLKYPKIDYTNLVSKHLERGDMIDTNKYPNYSKNTYIGVFNLKPFNDVVEKVIDDELNSKEINLKIMTKKKNSYTPLEMDGIYKRYKGKSESSNLVKTFTVPPVLIDDLDPIKTVFTLESRFLYDYYMMDENDIYNSLRDKAREYISVKNQKN